MLMLALLSAIAGLSAARELILSDKKGTNSYNIYSKFTDYMFIQGKIKIKGDKCNKKITDEDRVFIFLGYLDMVVTDCPAPFTLHWLPMGAGGEVVFKGFHAGPFQGAFGAFGGLGEASRVLL